MEEPETPLATSKTVAAKPTAGELLTELAELSEEILAQGRESVLTTEVLCEWVNSDHEPTLDN